MTTPLLDRRRDKSAAAEAAAGKAKEAVAELDSRLRANADLTKQQNQALRNAEAEVKRLKRALKTQERDHARLAKAHKKAVAKAGRTKGKAGEAEAKYSAAVLADLVRREKERDRAAAEAEAEAEKAPPVLRAVPEPAIGTAPVVPIEAPVTALPAPTPLPAARTRTTRATTTRATAAKAAPAEATPAPAKAAPVKATSTTTARTSTTGRATTARKATTESAAARRSTARRTTGS